MGLFSRIKKSLGGHDTATSSEAARAQASSPPAEAATAPRAALAATGATAGGADAATQAVAGPTENAGEILSTLTIKVAELSSGQMSPDLIDPTASLFDFGYVDSLSAVTLIAFLDETYGVSVTELDLVGSLGNIQALAEHIERHRRA